MLESPIHDPADVRLDGAPEWTAMLFDLFERVDRRWLVVPSITRAPARLLREGPLARLGTVALHFNRLTDELALAIARRGYGIAQPDDERRFRDLLRQAGILPRR